MLTLRTLAIVITGAGVFAGLPLTGAQACDDDRYPCPIRVPQETADAPNREGTSKARTGGGTRRCPREAEQTGCAGAGGRAHLAERGGSRPRDGGRSRDGAAACGSISQ